MKRRNFVKQSIAGAIVAATPLALTGLVRADGGGGNTTTTNESTDFGNSTDWWGNSESTVPWESTVMWESTTIDTTVIACDKDGAAIVMWGTYLLNGETTPRSGWMCANYVNCSGHTPSRQRTPFTPCDDNPHDNTVTKCPGLTELTGQDAVDFKNLPVCQSYED
jgi:hypothetical protein